MSTSAASNVSSRSLAWQRATDYLLLTKPKIVLAELGTVAAATTIASYGTPDLRLLSHALFGTLLVAVGASAWNQWLERHTDALMDRTADRPLPAARLSEWEVVLPATIAPLAGVVYLGFFVNLLTASLGALTWLIYVGIYTPFKSRSSANTAVGAVAGALPILMGWTAAGEPLNRSAATLFFIVFFWQFPHVMAIAWIYRRQYAAAGIKMLPVVEPTGLLAGVLAVAGASVLVPTSLLPVMIGFAGPMYFIWALALSLGYLYFSAAFLLRKNGQAARMLLLASLVYLPALLLSLAAGSFRC